MSQDNEFVGQTITSRDTAIASLAMEYHHPHFPFAQGHPMEHRPMLHHHNSHPQLMESYMHPHAHLDFSDFPPPGTLQDEYDENPEALSRPRLTKEQVEVLETQFQAHPKPNSNVKRQLAYQTKLTLPRVANWFQNRRAKAKQQKKQEEFEIMQAMGTTNAQDTDQRTSSHPHSDSSHKIEERGDETSEASSVRADEATTQASVPQPMVRSTSAQEASWASLQRALAQAEAARAQSAMGTFRPANLDSPQQSSDIATSTASSQFPSSTFSEWTNPSSIEWAGASTHSEHNFDFGLNIQPMPSAESYTGSEPQIMFNPSPEAISEPVSEEWAGDLQTPTLNAPEVQSMEAAMAHALPYPQYPQERRDSSPTGLSSGVNNMGIHHGASTPTALNPPTGLFPRRGSESIDIAGRRKKPRPAMLGSAALRSRSYGAPPTMSPTIRYNQSPVHHPLRHVKSTGANLNVHYGGIQKMRAAQRSPLNLSTFAEAEAFSSMMNHGSSTVECTSDPHGLSPETHIGASMPSSKFEEHENSNDFYQLASNMRVNVSSPPSTPLKKEYLIPPNYAASLAPPPSAPPQYAFFPDYTPPYSAGPLTTGSWSDAPLTSPEHSSFGHAISMAQPSYVQPMIHDFGSVTNFSHPFSSQPDLRTVDPSRQTEFFIQEFPQQKEAHAHAASQMSQAKPKNYVFANHTATDFSE